MDKTKTNHRICSDISIALCTCEGSFFLPAQLESLTKQSLLPAELVVCDDASTDDTVQLLEAFQEKAPFEVKLVLNEMRLGAVQNFSRAMELCQGRYVALCDQDDTWLPDRLETTMKAMKEAEKRWGSSMPLLVHSDLKVVGADGDLHSPSFMKIRNIKHIERQPLQKLLAQNFVTGNTVLVNRPLLEVALPVADNAIMHDWWLALVAAALGKIVFIKKPTVLYRQHDRNVIGASYYYSDRSIRRVLNFTGMEKDLASLVKQACALKELMEVMPQAKELSLLDDYTIGMRQGGVKAVATVLRSGATKQGLIRNLLYLALLLKKGYLKYY